MPTRVHTEARRTVEGQDAFVLDVRECGHKGICPTCAHIFGPNRRALRRGQIGVLVTIAATGRAGVTEEELNRLTRVRGKDWHCAQYFELIRRGSDGRWRPTATCVPFLRGETTVPRALWIELGKIWRSTTQRVSVHTVYRDGFDLSDVLNASVDLDWREVDAETRIAEPV